MNTSNSQARLVIDLAIFAYNEASNVTALMETLSAQDIWNNDSCDIRLLFLANGCTDQTVTMTRALLEQPEHAALACVTEVMDLPEGGKSRTVNRFIHEFARSDADIMGLMDADILLPSPTHLTQMVQAIAARPELMVFNSRPVKDIVHAPHPLGFAARIIAMGGGTLDDFRTAICGQLYLMRGQMARRIHMPVGLPVEDGFMRAMVATNLFREGEDLSRLDGDPDLYHVYTSLTTIREVLRHQIRIVVGGAVNNVVFSRLAGAVKAGENPEVVLRDVAADDNWLARILKEELPQAPYGYVPFHFLIKRLSGYRFRGLKNLVVTLAGFALDLASWLGASWVMARRNAAGFW